MLFNRCFLIVIAFLSLGWQSIGAAQIRGDRTTGTVIKRQGKVSEIRGGRQAGNNLFHSFKEFSVPEGAEAFFNNNKSVGNIFSRVTGGNISKIEGLIKANNANLILINPNGIVFSNGAQLQLGKGSFLGTTGEAVIFKDGTSFSARDSGTPLLTISTPIGIKINHNPGAIEVRDSFLSVDTGQTLALIGGNINLNAGLLSAPGGTIELGGLSQSGIVGLDETFKTIYPDKIGRADLTISNFSFVDVTFPDEDEISSLKANININVNNLHTFGFNVISVGIKPESSLKVTPGNININATGNIQLSGATNITNTVSSNSEVKGGDINITTNSLYLLDGSQINSVVYLRGKANNININAKDKVILAGISLEYSNLRSGILSQVAEAGQGQVGAINIKANSLEVTNKAFINADTFGKGDAGNIIISAKSVIINNNATIRAITFGKGNAGNVFIDATNKLIFQGNNRKYDNTGLYSAVAAKGIGKGGNLEIKTQLLEITNKAQINVNTLGKGNAGNISINAKTIAIINRGRINSNSFGKGDAGNISINATNKLILDGNNRKNSNTGIFSNVGKNGRGVGGDVEIVAKLLEVINRGKINANSQGEGNAGNITITSSAVRLSNNVQIATFASQNTGDGGNIAIKAGSILAYKNSDILGYSLTGKGGNIKLNTPVFFGQGYFGNSQGNPEELQNNKSVDINATGKISSGNISLPDLSLVQNALAKLDTNILDTNALIANTCLARSNKKQGRFIILGSGSLLSQPGDFSNSVYPTSSVRSAPVSSSNIEQIKEAIEPQGVYQLENGEIIIGRECQPML